MAEAKEQDSGAAWPKRAGALGAFTELAQLEQFAPMRQINYTIHVSRKFSYVYVETPKVACTSIKASLQRMELGDPAYEIAGGDVHDAKKSPLSHPKNFEDFPAFFNRPGVVKFCFVRNPYTRLLSCYLDKIAQPSPQRAELFKKLRAQGKAPSGEMSFAEFVDVVCQQKPYEMNPHWRLQTTQIFLPRLRYDVLGRLETLEQDLDRVDALLGGALSPYVVRKAPHRTGADEQTRTYYTEEIRAKVFEKFRRDFVNFGYARELEARISLGTTAGV